MNIILTAYFNGKPDPQRGYAWEADIEQLRTLAESCDKLIVLTDCLDKSLWPHVTLVPTLISGNPYFERWSAYYEYLIKHPEVSKVFCLDANDTEILQDPFDIEHFVYVGDEKDTVGTEWLVRTGGDMARWFSGSNLPLLNPGILGGHRNDVLAVLRDFNTLAPILDWGLTDMGLWNFLLHTKYIENIKHGYPLNSHFNKFQEDSTAWIRHK